MKKKTIIFFIFMMIQLSVFCIVPKYHGARSLSLGYTTTAFTFDINMLFINPSFLSTVSYSMSGYQYQQSYQSYFDFYKRLNTTLSYEIEKFYTFPDTKKKKSGTLSKNFTLAQQAFTAINLIILVILVRVTVYQYPLKTKL